MSMKPRRPEIDEHTIKLIVGVIALSLGNLTAAFAGAPLASISASYYAGGWSQSIFIGFLFATASFLIAYNGQSAQELVASKVAGAAALGVALFPCDCDGHPPLVPYVHYSAAAVLFSLLTYFCYCFFKRAGAKGHTQAKARAAIYACCGAAMSLSLLTLVIDHLGGGPITRVDPLLTFHCEYAALTAFGVSWLTASRVLPVITRRDERISLLPSAPRE